MGKLSTAGALALPRGEHLFAALKRCATRTRNCVSQKLNRAATSGLLICAAAALCSAQSQMSPVPAAPTPGPKADAIYIHGNIYTGVPAAAQFSSVLREEAIAVRGDRIQAVGKKVDIEKLKGPQTQVIDLGGRFVMPGFNDAHLHLADAGGNKLNVDLTGVKTLEELRERLRAKVQTAKGDEWIQGGGWDETLWPVNTLPSRWDLDAVSENHPVYLDRVDGHLNWRTLRLLAMIPKAASLIAMPTASLPAYCARPRSRLCGP
jgi:hypothetical protein